MVKTILITGATDGLGLATARHLAAAGHQIVLHGRNPSKLASARSGPLAGASVFVADLSDLSAVRKLADAVRETGKPLDGLINNAGVFKTARPHSADGQDMRFIVNTLAPYLLTRLLLPAIPVEGRVISLSSAAQAPVNPAALEGKQPLGDMEAYAQSKLALIIWTRALAAQYPEGPGFYALNPASLLATNMVREGFGVAGSDPQVGVDIMSRAALSEEFEGRSGSYYDNDAREFADPHPHALDPAKAAAVMAVLDRMVAPYLPGS